jgi:Tol biopolymer transport system component
LQETWDVTIGGQALQGTTLSVPQTTATAWTLDTINFTYSGTSGAGQVLQFLATSNQNGAALPPFLLLDGVSLQVMTPEPATVSYLLMAGLSFCLVRKRLGKRS